MQYITIALAKGRLAQQALDLLEGAGYDCGIVRRPTRKLILEDPQAGLRFILAKPADVPTYVDYGAADIGIVGKDTLLEENRQLYEVLDLGFAACRLCVCGFSELKDTWQQIPHKRVATKYPRVTQEYFSQKKQERVEIIRLNGSVELAPLIGLSELIVDIVESGRTLADNGLIILDTIAQISARLVINRVSLTMKRDRIQPLIEGLNRQLTNGGKN